MGWGFIPLIPVPRKYATGPGGALYLNIHDGAVLISIPARGYLYYNVYYAYMYITIDNLYSVVIILTCRASTVHSTFTNRSIISLVSQRTPHKSRRKVNNLYDIVTQGLRVKIQKMFVRTILIIDFIQ